MSKGHSLTLAAMFKGLVKQVGGTEAARAVIEAHVGDTVSKGTISQIQNAKAMVPWEWVAALEDAAGNLPFHRLRAQQVEGQDAEGGSLVSHLELVKESAEAAIASAEAENSNCPKAIAESLKQMRDVILVAEKRAAQDQARLDRMGLGMSE